MGDRCFFTLPLRTCSLVRKHCPRTHLLVRAKHKQVLPRTFAQSACCCTQAPNKRLPCLTPSRRGQIQFLPQSGPDSLDGVQVRAIKSPKRPHKASRGLKQALESHPPKRPTGYCKGRRNSASLLNTHGYVEWLLLCKQPFTKADKLRQNKCSHNTKLHTRLQCHA